MKYFYDYFARQYRESRNGKLLPAPTAIFQGIKPEDVKNCRRTLKNSFVGYREGRNVEILKRLIVEYREYISCCYNEHAKDRYNAFIYHYMVEEHVGVNAIGAKLGVTKKNVYIYINRVLDEILILCMGIPAASGLEYKETIVRTLIKDNSLFKNTTGEYVLSLFPDKQQQRMLEQSRQLTMYVMEQFAEAVGAYKDYCNDEHTHIDTDIRKMEVLEKCLAGVLPTVIAEEYKISESTVYADMRENEKRLVAMLFDDAGGSSGRVWGKWQ